MILAEQSPGVCVADYDGDGWPDIYFPNGGDVYECKVDTRNALYHNNGDGAFTDVTEKPGAPLWTLVWNSVGGSYLSQSDLRATFGLGKETIAKVEINLPSGVCQTFHDLKADAYRIYGKSRRSRAPTDLRKSNQT